MPCKFLADTRHIYIFLPTNKYTLHIPGRYLTDLHISPTITYALHIPGRHVTDFILSPHNLKCPAYS